MRRFLSFTVIGAAAALAMGGAATAQQGLVFNCASSGDFCDFAVSPGFLPDPLSSGGMSGGPVRTADCGNIDRSPDHVITVTRSFAYLRVHADAPADVTLVVEGPFGRKCDGEAAAIDGAWPAGAYEVWVGDWQDSWSQGEAAAYTLYVTESMN